jgi:adenine phosphoribosyltransferase
MEYFEHLISPHIRTVADWPEKGIMFRDITYALKNKRTLRLIIDAFVHRYHDYAIDYVAAVDARGFILGAPLAYALNVGFIPIRKKGKLPGETVSEAYQLEYGEAALEVHKEDVPPHAKVLLIDDLVATGGTLAASANLLTRLEANVVEIAALINLPELKGKDRLQKAGHSVFTLIAFEGQ